MFSSYSRDGIFVNQHVMFGVCCIKYDRTFCIICILAQLYNYTSIKNAYCYEAEARRNLFFIFLI